MRQLQRLLAGCVLAAVGCGVTAHGELSASECVGGKDEDHDGLTDCDDPDCWVYDFCSQTPHVVVGEPDAPASMPTTAGSAATKPVTQPELDPGDSGVGQTDAAVLVPPVPECGGTDDPACSPGQTCMFGLCKSVTSTGDDYLLRVRSADLPNHLPLDLCYDTLIDGCPVVTLNAGGAVSCELLCKPDPYVVTYLNGDEVNRTGVDHDSTEPIWTGPYFPIHLSPTDILTFTVFDSDPNAPQDYPIFSCTLDTTGLGASGGGQCRPMPGARARLAGDWKLTVEVSAVRGLQ